MSDRAVPNYHVIICTLAMLHKQRVNLILLKEISKNMPKNIIIIKSFKKNMKNLNINICLSGML